MFPYSAKKKVLFGTALVLLASVGFAGCGGKTKDEDAEWVAENAGADTASVPPSAGAENAPVAETAEAEPTVTEVPPTEQASAADEAPAPAAPVTGEIGEYAVKKDDTLMKVAFEVYGDISRWRDIYELNKSALQNADVIHVGAVLKYEKPAAQPVSDRAGDPYLIKRGDTLGSIAEDIYSKRSKWRKLYENNKSLIHDPNRIYAGFYLYYQMTEEERREAEVLRKGLPPRQRLGKSPSMGAPQQNAADGQAPSSAAAPSVSSGAPGANGEGGGLNSLAIPAPVAEGAAQTPELQSDRLPTATQ